MDKDNVKELVGVYGWEDLGEQRNKYMISFIKDDIRMNIYFTTGTVTFQSTESTSIKGEVHKNLTVEELEKLLIK